MYLGVRRRRGAFEEIEVAALVGLRDVLLVERAEALEVGRQRMNKLLGVSDRIPSAIAGTPEQVAAYQKLSRLVTEIGDTTRALEAMKN